MGCRPGCSLRSQGDSQQREDVDNEKDKIKGQKNIVYAINPTSGLLRACRGRPVDGHRQKTLLFEKVIFFTSEVEDGTRRASLILGAPHFDVRRNRR